MHLLRLLITLLLRNMFASYTNLLQEGFDFTIASL